MTWIEDEEFAINKEIRSKKSRYNPDNVMMIKLILLIAFLSTSYLCADGFISCPECRSKIELRGIWGETWVCPNEDCEYENYVGINYCGKCGTWRYK